MNTLLRVPAVFEFEWRRAMTVPRMAWMLVLCFLPPILMLVVKWSTVTSPPDAVSAVVVFVLCPGAACMMSVFLIASPAVAAELEGRSWTYLSVRPYGPLAVLIGKYLVAVSWAIPVGIVSSGLSLFVLQGSSFLFNFVVEAKLVVLSCVTYAALYLFLGVVVPKRAMVLGIVYTIFVEVALSSVPAVVNLLTIQYRLRCLLVDWAGISFPERGGNQPMAIYFGDTPASYHVMVLFLISLLFLSGAAFLLRYREFTSAAETDI